MKVFGQLPRKRIENNSTPTLYVLYETLYRVKR